MFQWLDILNWRALCRAYIGPQILVMACDARKNSGAARKLGSTDRYGVKTEKKQTVQLCRLFDKGFEDRKTVLGMFCSILRHLSLTRVLRSSFRV